MRCLQGIGKAPRLGGAARGVHGQHGEAQDLKAGGQGEPIVLGVSLAAP